jgi:hypothetical protein
MADNKTSEVVLRYRIDESSTRVLLTKNAQVKAELAQLTAASKQVDLVGKDAAKTTETFAVALSKIQRQDAVTQLARDYAQLAATTGNAEKAAAEFQKRLESLGATERDQQAAASAFSQALSEVGAGGGGNILKTLGREVKSLPAVQLGGGISTDAVAKIVQLLGSLPPVALPAVAALAAVGAGVAALNASLANTKVQLDAATKANTAYYDLLAKGATSGDAKKRLEELQRTVKAQEDELASINNAYAATFKATADSVGDGAARIGLALAQVSNADDDLTKRADDLKGSLTGNRAEMERLKQALDAGGFAANDAAEAEKKLADARSQRIVKVADDRVQQELFYTNALSLSKEAAQKQSNEINNQIAAYEIALQQLREYNDGSEEVSKKIDEYNSKIFDLSRQQTLLNDLIAEGVLLSDKERQQREETIQVIQRYNDQRQAIDEKEAEQLAAIEGKLADTRVSIAEKAADAEEAALQKLLDRQASLATSLDRTNGAADRKAAEDSLNLQIKQQRDEAKLARDHARTMQEIRQRAQDQEEDLLIARDFGGLYRLRRDTNRQLSAEETKYQQERADRAEAYQQQRDDQARQQAFERNERLIKYQQDLADAQAQYQKEFAQAEANRREQLAKAQQQANKEIALAQQKAASEQNILTQSVTNQLLTIQQGEDAKLQLYAAYIEQAKSLLAQASGQTGGASAAASYPVGNTQNRALGGALRAGAVSRVNEPIISTGRESFSNARGTVNLPGYGYFIPLQSGTVNRGGVSVGSLSITTPIIAPASASPRDMAAMQRMVKTAAKQAAYEALAEYS